MKKLLILTSFFIAIILIGGCKKYPDGPFFSLHSPEKRVTGRWNIDFLSVNGYDSSSYFKNQYPGEFWFREKVGYNPADFLFTCANPSISTWHASGGSDGHWDLTNNKKDISLNYLFCQGHYFILPPNDTTKSLSIEWQIQRLTRQDFWLKTNYNGKEYYMKLKQK